MKVFWTKLFSRRILHKPRASEMSRSFVLIFSLKYFCFLCSSAFFPALQPSLLGPVPTSKCTLKLEGERLRRMGHLDLQVRVQFSTVPAPQLLSGAGRELKPTVVTGAVSWGLQCYGGAGHSLHSPLWVSGMDIKALGCVWLCHMVLASSLLGIQPAPWGEWTWLLVMKSLSKLESYLIIRLRWFFWLFGAKMNLILWGILSSVLSCWEKYLIMNFIYKCERLNIRPVCTPTTRHNSQYGPQLWSSGIGGSIRRKPAHQKETKTPVLELM